MMRNLLAIAGICWTIGLHAEPLPEQAIPALLQARVSDTQGKAIVVGIIDAQGRRYFSHGPADASAGRAADQHTLFGLGSVTKLFTSLLLADMTVKGEVRLDDPVQNYLPSGVQMPSYGGQPITLLHLSTHRSGLPRETPQPHHDQTDAASLYRFISSVQLDRAPGKHEYSNIGASLLGFALAQRAGRSYEQLVAERIIEPLGLRETGIAMTPDLRARLAVGYLGPIASPLTTIAEAKLPSGGVYSTVSDMLTFLGAAFALSGSPLDAAMATMRRPYADQPDTRLAWYRVRRNGSDIWFHSGRILGYTSTVAFDTRSNRGVVMLSNSAGTSMDDLAVYILNKDLRPRQIVPPRAFVRMVEDSDYRQLMAAYRALRHRDPAFYLEEGSVNEWGGMLLEKRRPRQALAVLAFNAEQHPRSANAYDSLGLAHEANGQQAQAIAAYRKAVELDPLHPLARNAGLRLKALTSAPR